MLEHPPSTIFLAQGGIGLGCFVAPSYVWDTLQVPTVSPVVSCETAWVGDSLLAHPLPSGICLHLLFWLVWRTPRLTCGCEQPTLPWDPAAPVVPAVTMGGLSEEFLTSLPSVGGGNASCRNEGFQSGAGIHVASGASCLFKQRK